MTMQADGRDPHSDRTVRRRPDVASRRLVWGAIAFSAVLHLLFVAIYPSLFASVEPDGGRLPYATEAPRLRGMRVIRLAEEEPVVTEVERPEDPELEQAAERTVTVAPRGVDETAGRELAGRGRSAAERLRPNLTDRRLWAPVPQEYIDLTLEQREELALAGRIEEWYDSIMAAREAQSAWTDWTYTDGDGDRWGIADGQLFLGDYAIPLPAFSAAPGPAGTQAAWEQAELARQGANVAVQQTVRDRMEAIRARRDRERAAARADTTDGP